jgi:hypothetical protein
MSVAAVPRSMVPLPSPLAPAPGGAPQGSVAGGGDRRRTRGAGRRPPRPVPLRLLEGGRGDTRHCGALPRIEAGAATVRRASAASVVTSQLRPALAARLCAALLTLAALAALWFGAGALRGLRAAPAPARLRGSAPVRGGYRYLVRPGDTLWSIAVRIEPQADPRPLVDELAGQLHGQILQPGDVLVVP